MIGKRRLLLLPTIWLLLAGCGTSGTAVPPPPPPGADLPISLQLRRLEPNLQPYPFRSLLDFESGADAVFVKSATPFERDARHAHTGHASLALAADTQRIDVGLASVLTGQPFPGNWTLVGGFFYAQEITRITIASELKPGIVQKRTMALAAGRWTAVLLDISRESAQTIVTDHPGTISFTFENPRRGTIWFDDFLVVNNTRTWVQGADVPGGPTTRWSVVQRGFEIGVLKPSAFEVSLRTAEAAENSWRVEEANDLRVRLSSTGKNRSLVIYSDGRQYLDGQVRSLLAASTDAQARALTAQHDKPGAIEIAEGIGKIDRSSTGDANNDGYNEMVGAYQLAAAGAHVEFEIAPNDTPLVSPVVEVSGLPAGKPLVTLEGKLVGDVVRTDSGHLLIRLPGDIARPTTVDISIR